MFAVFDLRPQITHRCQKKRVAVRNRVRGQFENGSCPPEPDHSLKISSIRSLNRSSITLRFTLSVGVSSPVSMPNRSEEHTSELQSRGHLVCRLLLEKKKNSINTLSHDRT